MVPPDPSDPSDREGSRRIHLQAAIAPGTLGSPATDAPDFISATGITRPAVVGGYPLLHALGSGGVGEVFITTADDGDGGRTLVALKRLLPRHRGHPVFRKLLIAEAKLLRRIVHANVVRAVDTSAVAESGFFTMEYVDGWTLSEVVRAATGRGVPLPLEAALAIVMPMARALHAAHETLGKDGGPLHLVHADVSPSNVLLSRRGEVKLIDFGIARGRHGPPRLPGRVLGTLAYMSPEQVRDQPLTRQSDVFSLGILLWELTTQRRLFRTPTPKETASRIASVYVPPPRALQPEYCPQLEEIVLRALRPDPDVRFPTALRLDLVLGRYARCKGLEPTPTALTHWLQRVDPSTAASVHTTRLDRSV